MWFRYLVLATESKKQTNLAKDQHKLFKDKIHVIKNNRKDGVKGENDNKTEDGVQTKDCAKAKNDEIIDDVQYSCDEYKNLIDKILKFGLMDGDSQILIIKNLPWK